MDKHSDGLINTNQHKTRFEENEEWLEELEERVVKLEDRLSPMQRTT